ncbi:ABC transporter permease [Amycolatopsis pithecellobii]|uniref:ABC transporter permease subunit n=1 Tax=Amycolatopsis pithecellobii TaxID=664692 RepID=A0A6N7Z8H2_9PSEU|nr:ABC transporter permease [Amycolatopsis pithecellobii]MTD58004.1 ABC transporter permease subunit [Amycolatopsis pithecellobii]
MVDTVTREQPRQAKQLTVIAGTGTRARRRQGLSKGATRAITIASAVAVPIVIWLLVIRLFDVSSGLLPSPDVLAQALWDNFSALMLNTYPTVVETGVGYALAVVIGIPLGWVLARPGIISGTINTMVLTAQIIPKVALAPLLIVWFGFGYTPRITLVFLVTFFPIVVNAASGFRSVPTAVRDLGQVLGMGPWTRLRELEGPSALPSIFAGLKIASTFALIGAIVSEFISAASGLGFIIFQTQQSLNTPLLFAAVVVISVFGLVFYGLVALFERVAIPWHVSQRKT